MIEIKDFKKILKKQNYFFWIWILIIFSIGVVNLYSITTTSQFSRYATLYKSQIMWFGVAFGVGQVLSFINIEFLKRIGIAVYIFNLLLLLLVLIIGHKVYGAQRWINLFGIRFQPSEMMKISLVLMLSSWFSSVRPEQSLRIKDLFKPFLLVLLPFLLILKQPDLGTGLVLIFIFMFYILYKKLSFKSLFYLFLIGVGSSVVMYSYFLKPYQKQRIITFLNPEKDIQGSGYNAVQSKIAIGSGKFWGKGLKKSTQAAFHYLPENHTDFAFSIFCEEHGFLGAIIILGLYLFLIYKILFLATKVRYFYASLLCIGSAAIIFCHIFVNIGMITGVLPVVGLPLPFFSYGGSSLLTFCVIIGLVTAVSRLRKMF